ncbi:MULTISPECIES: class I SAM-dependent methyltransferase [unclassified Luteococcus]|uniref:class I SAM-dependent methyltransferase n=1 Tax=unclassified Luteococcus TaxID=2639923 RepID=UPI00313D414A
MGPKELWDSRYSHPNYVYGYRPNDFLVTAEVMLRRGSRVLVLGDGEGRNGVWLAQKGHDVTTVDLSEVGAGKARTLADERGVQLDIQVADLAEWVHTPAAQGPWDGIVSIFCHLNPELRRIVADALTPQLAPQGKLIMEAYTPAQPSLGTGGPKDPDVLLTRQHVLDEWPGLDLDVRLVERRIFEGMGHQGLGSVLQVLGQRKRG